MILPFNIIRCFVYIARKMSKQDTSNIKENQRDNILPNSDGRLIMLYPVKG